MCVQCLEWRYRLFAVLKSIHLGPIFFSIQYSVTLMFMHIAVEVVDGSWLLDVHCGNISDVKRQHECLASCMSMTSFKQCGYVQFVDIELALCINCARSAPLDLLP